MRLFKPDAVLAVKQRWATGWSLADVSSWLDLEAADVLRLVHLGLLTPEGEWAETDEASDCFNRHRVTAFGWYRYFLRKELELLMARAG